MYASLVAAVGRHVGLGIINESGAIGCFHAPGMCRRRARPGMKVFWRAESDKWARVIREAGIKAN
jgi:hypothetical protein